MLISTAAAYAGVFLLLYPLAGPGVAALGIVPVAVAGWLLGMRGGLVAGILLSLPGNTLLFNLAGEQGLDVIFRLGGGVGSVVLVAAGAGVGRLRDLGDKVREQASELEYRATHDFMTGLPNRALFTRRVSRALGRKRAAAVGRPENVALLFLDLDDFKEVNDTLGHEAGDRVLIAVAGRVRGCLGPDDTVARLGGDEFVVLLEHLPHPEKAEEVARRISGLFEEPFEVGGRLVFVTASIGVALAGSPAPDPDGLLSEADSAMYRAKENGKARHELARAG